MSVITHQFREATFSRLTYCDKCDGLLWGLRRQGVECTVCGYICHRHCQETAAVCIKSPPAGSYEESAASKALRTLQHQDASLAAQLISTPTSEHVKKVLVSATIHATDSEGPANTYYSSMPPLNPQATARNFSRFVSRCGPMFDFRDRAILLLSWDKPVDTLVGLTTYCLLCLYPNLLLFLPHMIGLYIIMYYHQQRFQLKPSSTSTPSTTSGRQTNIPSLEGNSLPPSPTAPSTSPMTQSADPKVKKSFAFSFATALFPALEESSPEYIRNLQNLQNIMGDLSDVYDIVILQVHRVDWSSEEETSRLLQALVLSMILMSTVVYFISIRFICLVGGVMLFLVNTRFAKFVIKELMPQITQLGNAHLSTIMYYYNRFDKEATEQGRVKEISLFENQRWWPGTGFAPQLQPGERSLWSDLSGLNAMNTKEDLAAPEGYHWLDDGWKLDLNGPWVDDVLGLGKMILYL